MEVGIDERKMLSKHLIKITSLLKKTDFVILHVETNHVIHYEGTEIVNNLSEMKFIVEQFPTTHIVIPHPIRRIDSKDLAIKIADIQLHLWKL